LTVINFLFIMFMCKKN